jgi:hypothetical protein
MKFYEVNPIGGAPSKFQRFDEIVYVDPSWHAGEAKPYPEGRRAKAEVHCPTPPQFPFLIPKHRYMFKESHPNFPSEFWSEAIAYELGKLMKIPVPPTFVNGGAKVVH